MRAGRLSLISGVVAVAAAASASLGCGEAAESRPLSFTLTDSEDAAVAQSPAPGTTIVPLVSLLCVELTTNGLTVVQSACTNGDAQRFQIVPIASDASAATYAIQTSLGTCLDFGSSPGSGAPVAVAPCLPGSARQSFTLSAHTDGSYVLASASGNGCLGPEDASGADGAGLITYTCAANAPSQRAYLAELGFRPRASNEP